ncbi:hypothetical protein BDA99DRAFT_514937 [Phascolomyces articulosus]|uniref:Uncharacterized protein n=1 Tax=Phascolomyces articulosus TaxID=60185 RepID=A0AAD5K6Z1_9FUNG|nr:hypothetical protein BDA99DRAFT_514937 [Phascolomyces articulosus]
MTHLSDFSYVERATIDVYISVYLVYSIWKNDRFRCLQPHKVFSGELRSILTVIMFVMMMTQAIVDFWSTYVKYSEGFVALPTGSIITKPFILWSPERQKPLQAMNYLQCVTFAFHTGVFFLMQCFWNYLSNSVAKKSFMGSFEFKFYIIWALGSVAMFPVLQWRFRNDIYLSEIVPQLAYGGEVLITAALGVRSNFRFKRIIAASRRNKSSASSNAIINRLSYFKEMNIILTIILFIYGCCFVILCADGLTEDKVINTNKFACDLLIANVNMGVIFLWLLFISIFHPRRNLTSPQNSAISKSGQESEFQHSKNDMEMTTAATTTNPSRPLSQRITNFLHNNNNNGMNNSQPPLPAQYGSEKYQQPTSPDRSTPNTTGGGDSNNGVFMRAMSPVNVDYPGSVGTETQALTSSAAHPGYNRNISIDDPYSSQSIVFSMVDPKGGASSPSTRYPTPTQSDTTYDYPMQSMPRTRNNPMTSGGGYHATGGDERSEYDVSDYHDDTAQSRHGGAAVAAPSFHDGPTPMPPNGAGRERMVTDWLYQSPDRK